MKNSVDTYKGGKRPGLFNMMSDFDEFFERAMRVPWSLTDFVRTSENGGEWFQPTVDVQESEQAFLISVDLPGVRKEDIKVDLDGRTLTVSGERKREYESKENGVTRIERSYGNFSRSFTLPENIELDKIEASLEDGVLQLALPKSEVTKPRSIQVGSGKGGIFSKLLGKKDQKPEKMSTSEKTETH